MGDAARKLDNDADDDQDGDGADNSGGGGAPPADNDEIRAEIRQAFKDMEEIDKERDAVNARADEIRARMEAKGITRKGFNAAFQRWKLDADQRQAHDFSFALCCNATGVGYQSDLFQKQADELLRDAVDDDDLGED